MTVLDEIVIKTQANTDCLPVVQGRLETLLEQHGASVKVSMGVAVAFEEIFVNICSYAYDGTSGAIETRLEVLAEEETRRARITLTDAGVAYDPLAKEDPDVTLSADERRIGGLGIYLVKQSMDSVSYRRDAGKNIFVMEKEWKKAI